MANLIIHENGSVRTRPAVNGEEITVKTPCSCSDVTGVQINGVAFPFYDASGNSLADMTGLFAQDSLIRVLIDADKKRAYILNADTNAYLEGELAKKYSPTNKPTAADVGAVPLNGKSTITSGYDTPLTLHADNASLKEVYLCYFLNGANQGYIGFKDGEANIYNKGKILHSGNIGTYAAPAGFGLGTEAGQLAPSGSDGNYDANLIRGSGFYRAIVNVPSDNWYRILHIQQSDTHWSQVAFNQSSGEAFIRACVNGAINNWVKLATTDYAVGKTGNHTIESGIHTYTENAALQFYKLNSTRYTLQHDGWNLRVIDQGDNELLKIGSGYGNDCVKINGNVALHTGNKELIYTYGTEDLQAGTTQLETGKLHFVYE